MSSSTRRRIAVTAWILWLAFAGFLGSVHLVEDAEHHARHGAGVIGASPHFHVEESHPDQPLHAESSHPSEASYCDVCAHLAERSQARSSDVLHGAPPAFSRGLAAEPELPWSVAIRLLQPRAPPCARYFPQA